MHAHGVQVMIFRKGRSDWNLKTGLVMFLELAENLAGVPFEITSAYREGDAGAHGEGWAVDIACSDSRTRFKILRGLIGAGFRRIGIYDGHIHADRSLTRSDNVVWLGVSK